MTLIDYYDLLSIEPTAEVDAIKLAVRQQRREWTRRQNHPDTEIRQRAEIKVRGISEAEETLLNEDRRRAYDQELAAKPAEQPIPATGGARDWVAIANEYLDKGEEYNANRAAREATQKNPEDPRAWIVRSLSSSELGNPADAAFEAKEAIRLEPRQAVNHAVLGDALAAAREFDQAKLAYEDAFALEPDNPFYVSAVGHMLASAGRTPEAIQVLEGVVEEYPQIPEFKVSLGSALLDQAFTQWSVLPDGRHIITNSAQLAISKKTVERVKILVPDHETDDQFGTFGQWTQEAEQRTWHRSNHLGGYIGVVALLLVVRYFQSIIADYLLTEVPVLLSIIMSCLGGVVIAVYIVRHSKPEWQWSRKDLPQAVLQTGLQR